MVILECLGYALDVSHKGEEAKRQGDRLSGRTPVRLVTGLSWSCARWLDTFDKQLMMV